MPIAQLRAAALCAAVAGPCCAGGASLVRLERRLARESQPSTFRKYDWAGSRGEVCSEGFFPVLTGAWCQEAASDTPGGKYTEAEAANKFTCTAGSDAGVADIEWNPDNFVGPAVQAGIPTEPVRRVCCQNFHRVGLNKGNICASDKTLCSGDCSVLLDVTTEECVGAGGTWVNEEGRCKDGEQLLCKVRPYAVRALGTTCAPDYKPITTYNECRAVANIFSSNVRPRNLSSRRIPQGCSFRPVSDFHFQNTLGRARHDLQPVCQPGRTSAYRFPASGGATLEECAAGYLPVLKEFLCQEAREGGVFASVGGDGSDQRFSCSVKDGGVLWNGAKMKDGTARYKRWDSMPTSEWRRVCARTFVKIEGGLCADHGVLGHVLTPLTAAECSDIVGEGGSAEGCATKWCAAKRYRLGPRGSECVLGEVPVSSFAECTAIANLISDKPSRWAGKNNRIPVGCSLRPEQDFHFNLAAVGRGRVDLQPICLPAPSFRMYDWAGSHGEVCSEGFFPVLKDEWCREASAAGGQYTAATDSDASRVGTKFTCSAGSSAKDARIVWDDSADHEVVIGKATDTPIRRVCSKNFHRVEATSGSGCAPNADLPILQDVTPEECAEIKNAAWTEGRCLDDWHLMCKVKTYLVQALGVTCGTGYVPIPESECWAVANYFGRQRKEDWYDAAGENPNIPGGCSVHQGEFIYSSTAVGKGRPDMQPICVAVGISA